MPEGLVLSPRVRCAALVLVVLSACFAPAAWVLAQPGDEPPPCPPGEEPCPRSAGTVRPYEEFDQRVRSAQMVTPLASDVFGEQVSLYNGATQFSVVDIDLPGNSALPVRLRRSFKVEPKKGVEPFGGFGAWDVDVPYISGVFDGEYKWQLGANGAANAGRRCSTA